MVLGAIYEISFIKSIGTTLFVLCWLVGAFCWFIFMGGMLSGKYKNIKEKNWENQLW